MYAIRSYYEIVGEAENGQLAIDMVKSLKPDVISMDLNMPLMDGIVATQKIMCENPTPIVIVSSFYRPSEIEMAMKVLEAGAVNIMPKPYGPAHEKYVITSYSIHYTKLYESRNPRRLPL